MISNEEIRIKLDGYPEELLASYNSFSANRDPDDLSDFVIGLIYFLQDENPPESETSIPDTTSLREDLGVDSITIAEIVFLLEEILEIEIDNKDLLEISTIGQLKQYILQRIS